VLTTDLITLEDKTIRNNYLILKNCLLDFLSEFYFIFYFLFFGIF